MYNIPSHYINSPWKHSVVTCNILMCMCDDEDIITSVLEDHLNLQYHLPFYHWSINAFQKNGEGRGVITRAQIQHLLLWIVILILWYNFELKKDDFWGLFLVLIVCAFSWHPLRKMCNFLNYCCYYWLWKINTDLVEDILN